MTDAPLRRELGPFGAMMLGLGSILGTGVFVSLGLAAGVTGPAVVGAIALAGLLATCNALSSAQLAANHPTSGGTYEYGHVYLTPWLGFSAGWLFLCAKSASAATAALGAAGYVLALTGGATERTLVPLASGLVVVLVAVVLGGLRRSHLVNVIIVSMTCAALLAFVVAGLPAAREAGPSNFRPFFGAGGAPHFLEAIALMFVAYTGYGRIATLGEEVKEPRRTIPRAIVLTLVISMALYLAVAAVGIGAVGTDVFFASTTADAAPLAEIARGFGVPGLETALAVGAVTAMLGVLLNLILGLSRVALAMGRRRDLPRVFARVHTARSTPAPAVLLVGAVILGLTAIGSIRLAWSFSAFTVLLYYAITNAAALRLPRARRLYPAFTAWFGLAGCLGLAFWVEPRAWAAGIGVLALGLLGRAALRRGAAAV